MKKKQATIKDIARELKISHSTVSRALSEDQKVSALVAEKTRKQVQQKAAELDYSPNLMAQGFVTGKTGTLGLQAYGISGETYGAQTDQILRAADTHNYQILITLTYPQSGFHTAQTDQDQGREIQAVAFSGHRRTVDSYAGHQRRVRAYFGYRAGTSARGDFSLPNSKPEWGCGRRYGEFLRGYRAFDPVGSRADWVYRSGLE